MKTVLHGTWLAAALILPLLWSGCASNQPDVKPGAATNPDWNMFPAWQNASGNGSATGGATAPETTPPVPPPATLGSGITGVGGPVSTKPAYATYDVGWPRIFDSDNSTNVLYEPQVVSWTGMVLEARAVVSIHAAGAAEPIFGILHLQALTFVDKVERTVHFEDLRILDANFPSAKARQDEYSTLWLGLLKKNVRSVSLDRIAADLAVRNAERKARAVPVLNPVPEFIFSTTPTLLIHVSGDPVYRTVTNTDVERLLNTRAFLAKVATGQLYLHLWDGYVTAATLSGPWTVADDVPKSITKAEAEAVKEKAVDLLGGLANPETHQPPSLKTTPLPTILVVITSTELIVFEGPADWLSIPGTDLLYVKNTVANVFKYLPDQQTYLLVSGRWFKAPSLNGPWSYVAGDELPKDFGKIPDNSDKENVLASVPGTPQARQALIENGIPQNAKVDRATTHMPAPEFDGAPKLKPIDGTPLYYVVNTATPIIKVNDQTWYALANGIWFVGASVNGPWVVATFVPAVIYSIPPSSPLYYVTYVSIYSYDSMYVWTGYTPGYYGTVVAPDGVVVYGTGYYYSPWVGSVYYAPPITYGYYSTMVWTPWAGWGYGYASGWAWGASYGYWCACPCAPYWGPYYGWCSGAYYNGYGGVTAWGPGGWAATTGNMYSHWGNWSSTWRGAAGYNAYTGRNYAYKYGTAYNSVTGTMATGERGAVANVHTGNYTYGGRGVAYNQKTGMSAAGSHYTVGNAYTGYHASIVNGAVTGPNGKTATVSGYRTATGGDYDVNGHAFATDDGNIYHQNAAGGWDHYNASGSWDNVQNLDQNRALSSQLSSQNFGAQQADSWENHGWQDGGGGWGGGNRSWGGGGWGGGGGFGGFRGGGFGGFRR